MKNIKVSGTLGLILIGAMGCASSRNGASADNQNIISTDTLRVAHVRYTPDGDYVNLEKIKNGQPTEQYTEITVGPDSETTFFGDTILAQHKRTSTNLINISALRRMNQK